MVADNNKVLHEDIVINLMQRLSLKEGIKKFGDRANQAAYSELEQQHLRDSFIPRDYNEMTPEQKKTIIDSIMLIEEKEMVELKEEMQLMAVLKATYQ